MSDKKLDDLFKNGMQDHRSVVPEDMWRRIVLQKNRDRKRLLFFWILTCTSAAMISIAAVLWFNTGKIATIAVSGHVADNHDSGRSDKHIASSENYADSSDEHAGKFNKPAISSKENTASSNEHAVPGKAAVNTIVPFRAAGQRVEIMQPAKNFYKSGLPTSEPNTTSTNKPDTTSSTSKQGTTSTVQLNTTIVEENAQIATIDDQKYLNTTSGTAALIAKSKTDSSLSQQSSTGTGNKNGTSKQSGSSGSATGAAASTAVGAANISDNKKEMNDQPDGRKWYLDFYLSPDYPLESGATDQPICYTTGAKINRNLGRHLSAKIGIQYSQLNFIKSFDMPLLAGYSIERKKWKFTANAGVVYNIYTWSNTDTLNSWIKEHTGFSLYAGIDLERQFNQTYSVFAEPYYRYRLSSMTISTAPFNTFIDVVGISIGLRVYFKQ